MHTVLNALRRPSLFLGRSRRLLLGMVLCSGSMPAFAQDEPDLPDVPARRSETALSTRGDQLAPEAPVLPFTEREPLSLPITGPIVVPAQAIGEEQPLYLDKPDNNPPPGTSYREDGWKREILPKSLLWQPPIANPLQPRFRILGSNLRNQFTDQTLDTTIGGTLPMARWTAPEPRDLAWQWDFIAVALSRWSERDRPAAQDYRYGMIISGASGNWSWKIAYEHTSCHVGDEQIKRFGDSINRDSHIREELVLGGSYTFAEQLRTYAIFGYAYSQSLPDNSSQDRTRYNVGFEWFSTKRYLRVIQPYFAFDMEFRGDQNYYANRTTQLGIRVQAPEHRAAIRFGLEHYKGRSPWGQYFDNHEEWIGFFAALDY